VFSLGACYFHDASRRLRLTRINSTDLLLQEKNSGRNGGRRLETWMKDLKTLQGKLKANPQFLIAVVGSSKFSLEPFLASF
jgi:hypothetical protein